jgi:hypothetical protein
MYAASLNQVEIWFSTLSGHAQWAASFTAPRQVHQAIDRFVAPYHEEAAPFEWTETTVHLGRLKAPGADVRREVVVALPKPAENLLGSQ